MKPLKPYFHVGKIKGPTTLRVEIPWYVMHGKRVKTIVWD